MQILSLSVCSFNLFGLITKLILVIIEIELLLYLFYSVCAVWNSRKEEEEGENKRVKSKLVR